MANRNLKLVGGRKGEVEEGKNYYELKKII